MKYAIISDLHSNLESFKKFLILIKKMNINKIVCLGDVVGYNADPEKVISILSGIKNLEIIRGNHDRAVSTGDTYGFSGNASRAAKWTSKNISRSSMMFLKSLKKGPSVVDDIFGICHGSYQDEDSYILTKNDAKYEFKKMKKNNLKILFFGHTHKQQIYKMENDGFISIVSKKKFKLESDSYYLINPGSMGQPRDQNPKASFCIFDSEKLAIKIIRYDYAVKETQQKILNNNLPEILAYRLTLGR